MCEECLNGSEMAVLTSVVQRRHVVVVTNAHGGSTRDEILDRIRVTCGLADRHHACRPRGLLVHSGFEVQGSGFVVRGLRTVPGGVVKSSSAVKVAIARKHRRREGFEGESDFVDLWGLGFRVLDLGFEV